MEEFLDRELNRLKYRPKTIARYKACMKQLSEYFPNTPMEDISLEQIEEYYSFMVDRRRLAPSTVRQAMHAIDVVFNDIYKKGYDIKSFRLPKVERRIPAILSETEILTLLDSIQNIKHKTILSLIYSAGLEVSEAVRLKVKDIDFKNNRVRVRQIQGRSQRNAILSQYVRDELEIYLEQYKPTKWLFEGRKKGSHYSTDGVKKTFKKALRSAGIHKQISVKTLKYSYVKHLERQGIPLRNTLQELDLGEYSLLFYSELDAHNIRIQHSPLDRIIYDYHDRVKTASLEKMIINVQNEDERDYLLEAIKCINAGAYRASIILAWAAAIRNIHHKCMKHSLDSLNTVVRKHRPKAPQIRTIDDFAHLNDRLVLEVSQDLGEFDKNEKGVLIEHLNLRNKCGHPGKYKPQALKVAAFIEDLITIVFSKP